MSEASPTPATIDEERVPIYAHIEPTTVCNLNCGSCPRLEFVRKTGDGKVATIACERLERLLVHFPALEEVKFQGLGEPFLAHNMVELAETLNQRMNDGRIVMITSAAWPERVDVRGILANVDHLYVSVDGPDRNTFEAARPPAKFNQVISNVLRIMREKPAKTKVSINCCFSTDSYEYLHSIVILAKALGITSVRFNLLQNWTSEAQLDLVRKVRHEQVRGKMLTSADIAPLVEEVKYTYDLAGRLGIDATVVGNPDFQISECKWGHEMVYVTVRGDLLPCSMRCDPRNALGNLFESSFEEIRRGPRMQAFLGQKRSDRPPDMCRDCPYVLNKKVLTAIREGTKRETRNDHLLHL